MKMNKRSLAWICCWPRHRHGLELTWCWFQEQSVLKLEDGATRWVSQFLAWSEMHTFTKLKPMYFPIHFQWQRKKHKGARFTKDVPHTCPHASMVSSTTLRSVNHKRSQDTTIWFQSTDQGESVSNHCLTIYMCNGKTFELGNIGNRSL